MLLERFVGYVLRGRKEAVMVALACAIIPFMGWLGVVVMALVTLRQGAKDGLVVLLWMALPPVVLAILGYPASLYYSVLCGSLVVWVMAIILRDTASWDLVIQLSALLAIIVVAVIHGVHHDIYQYWYNLLEKAYAHAKAAASLPVPASELTTPLQLMAKFATGATAAGILLANAVNLALARWLQSIVFNPGGLAKELHQIRVGLIADGLLILILIGVVFGLLLAWDVLPIALLVFFVAGLSLIHSLSTLSKYAWLWLSGFYLLLILFFPYIAVVVIMLALADSWLHLRARLLAKT